MQKNRQPLHPDLLRRKPTQFYQPEGLAVTPSRSFSSSELLLPLRRMPLQPPARRMPLLWKERSAASRWDGPHEVVLHFVSLQRSRQKLIHLYRPERTAARHPNPQQHPIPHKQIDHQEGQHHQRAQQPSYPLPHEPKYCTCTYVPSRTLYARYHPGWSGSS